MSALPKLVVRPWCAERVRGTIEEGPGGPYIPRRQGRLGARQDPGPPGSSLMPDAAGAANLRCSRSAPATRAATRKGAPRAAPRVPPSGRGVRTSANRRIVAWLPSGDLPIKPPPIPRDRLSVLLHVGPPPGHPLGMSTAPFGLELVAVFCEPSCSPSGTPRTRRDAFHAIASRPTRPGLGDFDATSRTGPGFHPIRGPSSSTGIFTSVLRENLDEGCESPAPVAPSRPRCRSP